MPGIYADLLEGEREHETRTPRLVLADPTDPDAGHFRRPRQLLDALEAGEPVTVPHWQLGARAPRFLRHTGGWYRVHADDVVEPTGLPTVVDRPELSRRYSRVGAHAPSVS